MSAHALHSPASGTLMQSGILLRHAFVLAFLLIGTGWTAAAQAQSPASSSTPRWASITQGTEVPESEGARTSAPRSLLADAPEARASAEWIRTYDGHGERDDATGIAVGPQGNVYVTGWSVVESGDNQYATVKYAPDGTQLWVATFDDPAGRWDEAYAIAVDGAGNAYVTGRSYSNGFAAVTIKYDADGVEQWVRRSTTAGFSKSIALDAGGNVYVAGIGHRANTQDFVLTKYSPDGDELWVRTYEAPGADIVEGNRVAISAEGGIYVGGGVYHMGSDVRGDYLVVRYAADGTEVWAQRYYNEMAYGAYVAFAADASGNVFIGGSSDDRRIVKFTAQGDVAWSASIGGEGGAVRALAADAEGNVFVGGIAGCSDIGGDGCFSVGKYDADGGSLWEQRYPGYGSFLNVADVLAVDPDGNVYAGGRSEKFDSLLNDYVTAKYHADGDELWIERYEPSNYGELFALAVDGAADAVYVTGSADYDFTTIKYVSDDGTLAADPNPLVFGEVEVGASDTKSLTLINVGTTALALVGVEVSPAVYTTEFAGEGATLEPGESETVTVTFTPTAAGAVSGTLTVESVDLTSGDVQETVAALQGIGVDGGGEAACVLALDPASFEDTIIGSTSEAAATVSNGGTDACELIGASASSPFSVEGFEAMTVAAGADYSFMVVYTPTEAGEDEGSLTVETDGDDLTANLSGKALDQPTPGLSAEALEIEVEPGQTASETLTLSNTAEAGAADLEYEVSVVAVRLGTSRALQVPAIPAPPQGEIGLARAGDGASARTYVEYGGTPLTYQRGGDVMITHSVSQDIADLTGVSCGVAGSHTSPNSYWRVFDLADFGLSDGLDVTSVDIGIESVNGVDLPSAVRLYTLDGAFTRANLTLVGETDFTLAGGTSLELVTVAVGGSFSAGDVLVVEWWTGDGEPTLTTYYPGSNSAGQTDPTYISSADCDITEPVTFASIGFPEVHWVMNVHGTVSGGGSPLMLTVSPTSGTIAPGDSDDLTLTVDATDVAPGTYVFKVLIATNDPATPILAVDLAVAVNPIISSEDGTIPTAFSIAQNYPNPFASRTVIEYGLPEASHVTVAVYDVVGRLVATLVDGKQAAGYHEAAWNAAGMASGVYLCRIQAGERVRTLKMVLAQ